jgi:hypothetical protein
VFGYGFAPRYRDMHKKMQALVGFENPGQYADMLIKPARKVYDDLIVKAFSFGHPPFAQTKLYSMVLFCPMASRLRSVPRDCECGSLKRRGLVWSNPVQPPRPCKATYPPLAKSLYMPSQARHAPHCATEDVASGVLGCLTLPQILGDSDK